MKVNVRAVCEVAPIQTVQIIVNGKVVHEQAVPAEQGRGVWIDVEQTLDLNRSSWIAARAFSKAPSGRPTPRLIPTRCTSPSTTRPPTTRIRSITW